MNLTRAFAVRIDNTVAIPYSVEKAFHVFGLQNVTLDLQSDTGVASSIPARSHTLVEIDHELISTAILLPSSDAFKKGCCQLQANVYVYELLVNCLFITNSVKIGLIRFVHIKKPPEL